MKLVNHYKQWQEAINEAPLISHDQRRACYVRDHKINDKELFNRKLIKDNALSLVLYWEEHGT